MKDFELTPEGLLLFRDKLLETVPALSALELYRECASNYREKWPQDYIDNPTIKKIACNPSLLRGDGINIAKIAHRFTMSKYGVSIKDYLK